MIKLLTAFLFVSCAFAQTVINLGSVTLSADAISVVNATALRSIAANTGVVAIPAAIGDLSITTDVPLAAGTYLIESEAIVVASAAANVATITRAAFGTTAAAHPAAAQVRLLVYATPAAVLRGKLSQSMRELLDTTDSPAAAALKAQIATLQAQADAAKQAVINSVK